MKAKLVICVSVPLPQRLIAAEYKRQKSAVDVVRALAKHISQRYKRKTVQIAVLNVRLGRRHVYTVKDGLLSSKRGSPTGQHGGAGPGFARCRCSYSPDVPSDDDGGDGDGNEPENVGDYDGGSFSDAGRNQSRPQRQPPQGIPAAVNDKTDERRRRPAAAAANVSSPRRTGTSPMVIGPSGSPLSPPPTSQQHQWSPSPNGYNPQHQGSPSRVATVAVGPQPWNAPLGTSEQRRQMHGQPTSAAATLFGTNDWNAQ